MKNKKWFIDVSQTKSLEVLPGLFGGSLIGINYTFSPKDKTWTILFVLIFITITIGRVDES